MNKIALVSAANDDYAELLAEMLGSIRDCPVAFDIKVFDLGLNDGSRRGIAEAAHDRSLEFLEPPWTRKIANQTKSPLTKKVYLAKPFIPDFFPGYDAYIWADADLWFQDPDAISHYIAAGHKYGAAFAFESHPLYRPPIKIKYFRIKNWVFVRGFKNYLFVNARRMFGKRFAVSLGVRPILNSGIFYLAAASPIWAAWQDSIRKANLSRHGRSDQICDQTCLQVAIFENGLNHAVLPAIYNWLPNYCAPVFDKTNNALIDPMYPHSKIPVIHLAGGKDCLFTVPVSDGTYRDLTLRWPEFSRCPLLASSRAI